MGLLSSGAEDRFGIQSSRRPSREAVSVCPEKGRGSRGHQGALGWWSFQDDLKIRLSAWPELPFMAVTISFPLPSKLSSTPEASVGHCPLCFLFLSSICQSPEGKLHVEPTPASSSLLASIQLVILRPLLAFLPGRCQEGGAHTVREALPTGPHLLGHSGSQMTRSTTQSLLLQGSGETHGVFFMKEDCVCLLVLLTQATAQAQVR